LRDNLEGQSGKARDAERIRSRMKVSVIGMGAVGAETVRSLLNMAEIKEIVAVNRTRARAEGEVEDLHHASALCGAYGVASVGDYPDLSGSDIVVMTAGTYPKAGGSREDVLRENCDIVRDIIAEVERYAPRAIVLIVANPVDVAAQVALSHSGFCKTRLISTGTLVDTMRLVRLVSDHVKIDPRSVSGYVVGEHGDGGLVPWSVFTICGMDVDTYCRLNNLEPLDKEMLRRQVVEAGHSVFSKKGYTNYGIGASISRIVRAIALDEKTVLPVGTLLEGEYGVDGAVMSLPCVIGRNGVEQIIRCDFSDTEVDQLKQSGNHIRQLWAMAEEEQAVIG
jgi:L-lactate dehydrogenase